MDIVHLVHGRQPPASDGGSRLQILSTLSRNCARCLRAPRAMRHRAESGLRLFKIQTYAPTRCTDSKCSRGTQNCIQLLLSAELRSAGAGDSIFCFCLFDKRFGLVDPALLKPRLPARVTTRASSRLIVLRLRRRRAPELLHEWSGLDRHVVQLYRVNKADRRAHAVLLCLCMCLGLAQIPRDIG